MKYNKKLEEQGKMLSDMLDIARKMQEDLMSTILSGSDGLSKEAQKFVSEKMNEALQGKLNLKDVEQLAKQIDGKNISGNK